ncbi:MAG: ERCC4 domain-containing protein [Phycisphaerae bacterium]
MIIQQDTREKSGKKDHILKYFEEHGIKVVRSKLYVGDWTRLDKQDVCIDTKQNLTEVYGNIVQQHVRFRDECIRSRSCGIRLILLVEQRGIETVDDVETWENPRRKKWMKLYQQHQQGKNRHIKISPQPPLSSIQLADRMKVMRDRYGIEWQFCTRETCGARIVEILGGENGSKD